ncbi:hypothetical protein SDC9_45956 [bioreactor metagenome]|uniref:Bacterial repeat domain-containing protein n=1 Tax=bioreactor metagenome TaxID=1076179 RepID=A0A644W7I3_9ZZZZ
MKKTLALLLMVVMILGLLPMTAFAADGDITVDFDSYTRVESCNTTTFDVENCNYIVAFKGNNYVVWTLETLDSKEKDSFIASFAAAADEANFQNIDKSGKNITFIYGSGDTATCDGMYIDGSTLGFDSTSKWSQYAYGYYTISVAVTYTVTTGIDNDGTITETASYNEGTDVTIEYEAADGYYIASVTVDGGTPDVNTDQRVTADSKQFLDIGADHSVVVTTVLKTVPAVTHTVTTGIDNDGTITETASYNEGTDVTIEYEAADGYYIASVTVDGGTPDVNTDQRVTADSKQFLDIGADHSVVVTTALKTVQVTTYNVTTQISHGTITPSASYNAGTSVSINYSAANGYYITSVTVDGGTPFTNTDKSVTTGSQQFDDIDADHSVVVTTARKSSGGNSDDGGDDSSTPTETDLGDTSVPLASAPPVEEPVQVAPVQEEPVIAEVEVPLGNLPQTGTTQTADALKPMWAVTMMALAFSIASAGLTISFGRKKEDEKENSFSSEK